MSDQTQEGSFIVLVTEPTEHSSLAILRTLGEVRLGDPEKRYTEESLGEALKDCDAVLITSRDRITRAHIESSPRLKVISKFGAPPENIDLEAAADRGIKVLCTPLANPESVAEHTVLLILAVQKRLRQVSEGLRAGEWRNRMPVGVELAGKTVGLVGFGSVGSSVAKHLSGFNVRVVVYDPWADRTKGASLSVEFAELAPLLKNSDVVSLHAMVTPQSRHMIGSAQLRMMKPSSILINTARGALVDEAALVGALEKGWIAGAGIDVFEEEPVSRSNPLLHMDCVVATPHIAAHTREAMDKERTWAAEDVRRVLLGDAPRYC